MRSSRVVVFSLWALCTAASAGTLRVNVSEVQTSPSSLVAGQVVQVSYTLSGAGMDLPGGLANVRLDLLRSGVPVKTLTIYPGSPGAIRGANTVPITLTDIPAGSYTVRVTPSGVNITAPDYFEVSAADNPDLQFGMPRGVDVNRNPSSPAFGRVYVSEGAASATANRTTEEGVYALNPDLTPAFPTARLRGAEIGSYGPWAPSVNSPFRVVVGPDSEVYVTDCSDPHSALFVADPDLSNLHAAFAYPAPAGGTRASSGLVTNSAGAKIYGSISSVWVEGSGANRSVFTTQEDLTPGNSLWQTIIPAGSYDNAVVPTLVAAPTGASWVQDVVRDSDGNSYVVSSTKDDTAKYSPAGTKLGSLSANTAGYYGICIDESANSILLSTNDGRVFKTDRNFTDSFALLVGLGADARDVAIDADKWIYVADQTDKRLRVFGPPGDYTVLTNEAESSTPFHLTIPVPGDVVPIGPAGKFTGPNGTNYGDGSVEVADAIMLLRLANGLQPAP